MDMETDMEMETNMEPETDVEMETKNTHTRTWTWICGNFAKYLIRRNSPYCAVWIASDTSRRNFQRRCILFTRVVTVKTIYKSQRLSL
jgi:hypothetical protein